MMLRFRENEDIVSPSETEFAQFEREHRLRLPEQYKIFLQLHKGGLPNRDLIEFGDDDGDFIAYFFGLFSPTHWKELSYGIESFPDPSMSGYLPVAVSNGGNYFLLKVAEPGLGSVHFWDHEVEEIDPPSYKNLIPVSESFDEFTASLKLPESDGEQDDAGKPDPVAS